MATVKVILEPKDVPGAMLREGVDIKDHSNLELRRWLECHGLKKLGNKVELIERVSNCINAGRADHISLAIDGGKWYDANRQMLVAPTSSGSSMNLKMYVPEMFLMRVPRNLPVYEIHD
ncbi:hypothetical protein FQR65_LT16359 [Abscondita terminalis]|nr:hypothetical protein FQR65_LT16359 [Abscondita terminalis]